jgi:outer membrane protein assembly factor BamE (lipoprotein component of BamABCDE complex)
MNKLSRFALLCCAVWLPVACAGHPEPAGPAPGELTVGKVQGEIKIGMSSVQVLEVLGAPNIVTTDDERREVWVYDKVSTDRMDAGRSSYGTLLLFGGSQGRRDTSTRQRTLTILIKYDAEKKVRDFAYNYTQF